MRRRRRSLPKRLLAVLLSAVFVLSVIPTFGLPAQAATEEMGIIGSAADDPTLDSWKALFDLNNLSTEHAGGIWTDKSVLTKDNLSALGNISGLTVGDNNFMVALSALAANSVVVGQGSKPTDTVFVLDVSGSMSSTELRSMVAAANNAIHILLSGSGNTNRVGVVLYSTEAATLLPLDHYTPVIDGGTTEYIELSNSSIRSARAQTVIGGSSGNWWEDWFGNGGQTQTTYLKDGNGNDVDRSVHTTGGTYIQGGLWEALSLFPDNTNGRNPVLVLMTDGAPTYTTNSFNNVPDESNYGSGNGTTTADGFVTQLTAAYVKEKMKEKYNATAYLYTLGMGIDGVDNEEIAKKLLDPSNNTHAGMEELWNRYEALATASNKTMTVDLGSSNRDPRLTYDATVAGKNAYVDRYFSATQASDLAVAFQNIVNEISLQAGYYVTHLDGENANLGGYITFIDEIGSGMQVKKIEGLLIDTELYTGKIFASALIAGAFGTKDVPTTLGDNFVWAIKERLGITDTQTAWALLDSAYAAGQLSCTLDGNNVTAFSNYIGWFSDANGDYVGFWNDKDPNAVIPASAKYANKCYLMLGSTTGQQTNHASDMMYVAIQVSKAVTDGEVLDKTPEQVTFRIPAALLPMITYQIKLNSDSLDTATQATVTAKAASPIRLLYEVGVHEKMSPVNVHEFMRENYQAKDADGNYYLYSNAWRWEDADENWTQHPDRNSEVLRDTSKNAITYAYFEPGADNEHYYFTEDQQIYVKSGNNYTALSSLPNANGEYYYKHYTFTNQGTGMDFHYGALSAKAVQAAIDAGTSYVPAGTLHYHDATHTHDVDKADQSVTDTYFAVRHQLVDAKINASSQTEHNYELVYMGNNGRLIYAPAQGISIEKQMADGTTPDVPFTFDVELMGVTGNTSYDTLRVAVDGTQSTGTVDAENGKLSVQAKPGEKVYVLGIPANVSYTVTERRADGYLESNRVNAVGMVEANTVKHVTFINRVREFGTLTVCKTVEYKNGATKNAASDANKFPVTVTLKDGDAFFGGTVSVDGTAIAVTNGLLTFDIVDGQTVAITGIPEGCTYEVAERTTLPSGYEYVEGANLQGVISTAAASAAALKNAYEPEDIVINAQAPYIAIALNKTLVTEHSSVTQTDFSFKLQQYDTTVGNWVDTGKTGAVNVATLNQPQAGILNIDGLPFTQTGTYDFRIVEEVGSEPGMTYDRTFHDFEVVVTDSDLDGVLEISEVKAVGSHTKINFAQNTYTVTADFTNEYALDSTKLTIEFDKILSDKALSDDTHTILSLQDGQFHFTLTEYTNGAYTTVKGEPQTVANGILGDIVFHAITYTEPGTYYYTVTEEIPNPVPAGYTYDTAEFYIAVTVGTDGSGSKLKVTNVEVEKDGTPINVSVVNNILTGQALYFNNIYKAAAADPWTLSGTKEFINLTPGLVGNPIAIEDGKFGFTLTGPNVTGGSETVKNVGAAFAFSQLIFNGAGEYTYTITEDPGNLPYITYDAAVYTATVTVVDDGTGKLKVVEPVSYTKDGVPTGSILFHNTYKATAAEPVILSGSKTLSGIRNIVDGEFVFVLKNSLGTVVETVKNVGGSFSFAPLNFNTAGTYTYTVAEEKAGQVIDGVTYDSKVYTVTIKVTDNDYDGKLETEVLYNDGASNALAFANTYEVQPVTVALTGRKNLAGRPTALQAEEFTFNLKGENIDWTVKNDATGNVTFGNLTYYEPGTHEFVLKEVIPAEKAPGIIYDETVYTVTITVTDNGKGQLGATVNIPGQDVEDVHFRFFNRYHAEDTDAVVLGGTKELIGRPLALQDNEFSFVLKNEAGEVVETVKNNGANFVFAGIVFDEAGEYKYTISELNGGQIIDGITYDAAVYIVTVTVVDDGTGKLEVETITYTKGTDVVETIVFNNIYEAKKTAGVVIEATKELIDITDGGNKALTPGDGKFSFNLKGEGVDETVKNIGASVKFSALEFVKPGTYTYKLTEIEGSAEGVTYDKTVYSVTVTVTDDGKGQLAAEVKYDQTPVFRNTYEVPKVEVENPKTGDETNLTVMTAMMMLSAVSLMTVLVIGKKKLFAE